MPVRPVLTWDEAGGEITILVGRKRTFWRALWLTSGSLAALGLASKLAFEIGRAGSSGFARPLAWILMGGLAGLALGANAIEAIRHLLAGSAAFKLNRDGILDPGIGRVIPWTAVLDIDALADSQTGRVSQLSLWVRNSNLYERSIGSWQKIFGGFVRAGDDGAIPLPSVSAGMLPVSTGYLLYLIVSLILSDPVLSSRFPGAKRWLPPAYDPWDEEILLLPEAHVAKHLAREVGAQARDFADARVNAARDIVDHVRAAAWARVREILQTQERMLLEPGIHSDK